MDSSNDEIAGQSEVTEVLKEMAEEEIEEVDIIMEDISDEIKDLQESITKEFEKELEITENYQFSNISQDMEVRNPNAARDKVRLKHTRMGRHGQFLI